MSKYRKNVFLNPSNAPVYQSKALPLWSCLTEGHHGSHQCCWPHNTGAVQPKWPWLLSGSHVPYLMSELLKFGSTSFMEGNGGGKAGVGLGEEWNWVTDTNFLATVCSSFLLVASQEESELKLGQMKRAASWCVIEGQGLSLEAYQT